MLKHQALLLTSQLRNCGVQASLLKIDDIEYAVNFTLRQGKKYVKHAIANEKDIGELLKNLPIPNPKERKNG